MQKTADKEKAVVSRTKLRMLGGIGPMTDKLVKLREDKRELEEKIKTIEAEFDEVSELLMERLEKEGADKATGKLGSVSISRSIVGNVVDWDAFGAWIIKHKAVHLLQRRLSVAAWREATELKGVPPPGTESFNKKTLNVRAV